MLEVTLMSALKLFSMYHGLSFPKVHSITLRKAQKLELPDVYATEKGEQIFIQYLESLSTDLFELVLPVFKGDFTPSNFVALNPRTMQNLRGEVGKTRRTTIKRPITLHVLIDNSEPYDYLKGEYIYDSIYEARTFINQLVRYLPPSRIELWRVRVDKQGNTRRDKLPVLVSKTPYKM